MLPAIKIILIGVILLLLIINIVLLIINCKKVKKYTKMYEKALAKFNSKENISDEFQSIYERLNRVESEINDSQKELEILNYNNKNNIQKVGLVKYNAYNDSQNKLSFALVILDENENGVLINHIYSKHGSNTYAKLVSQGMVDDRICEEEAEALRIAKQDKCFKERQTIDITAKKRK